MLGYHPPPFQSESIFSQLRYLKDYVCRPDLSGESKERVVAVESHYTDRDFMADHCVLFASVLSAPPNHCSRLHFFAGKKEDVQGELEAIAEILWKGGSDAELEYTQACKQFSDRRYLGFSVLRPLPGSRVGRTVLRLLPSKKEDGSRRVLSCTRDYDVHFAGADLNVRGLAYQQQDLGVSRCATIAIWCALHKIGDGETTTHVTPAEITNRASSYRLPFGRPMPSEGLAVDQMCLALQSVGIAPFLSRVQNFAHGRSLIHSATLSGIPAILVMQKMGQGNEGTQHAVTVVGMKLSENETPYEVKREDVLALSDESGSLRAVYVQDDRIGPYRRGEIDNDDNRLVLKIKKQSHIATGASERWAVTHILIPLHPKVRVSFNDLRKVVLESVNPEVRIAVALEQRTLELTKTPDVSFSIRIERGYRYVHRVSTEKLLSRAGEKQFRTTFVLPRYVAVIRFRSEAFGQFDILVDTTSPRPNYHWLAVVAGASDDSAGRVRRNVAEYIAECCRCELIE